MIWGFLGVLLAVILPVIARVLGDDARTGIPKLAAAIIRRAARRLPAEHQERWTEEWLAALDETEERSVMLWHAVSCYLVAAPRVRDELAEFQFYRLKRALDLAVVIAVGIWCLPAFLLVTVLVALDGRPVIYTRIRIGAGGKPFRAFKLRTMLVDADQRMDALLERDASARKEWAATGRLRNDPRLTALGRFLRATSLDEWPQLWNVLRGDMTLVGPRAKSPEQAALQGGRATGIPPGLTGPWQVSDVVNESARERIEEEYFRRMSLKEDLRLLLRTFLVVWRGK